MFRCYYVHLGANMFILGDIMYISVLICTF